MVMGLRQEDTALNDRDVGAYTLAEGARYTRLPLATLRSWALGREYPTAEGGGAIRAAHSAGFGRPPLLSFSNLVEAHVLRSLRTEHGVSVKALRKALAYAERALDIDRLLLRPELRTEAGKIFLDYYGELIELSTSGQLVMRRLLEAYLKRIEWDSSKLPVRLYPFVFADEPKEERSIVIDPRIAFGRPVLLRKGISTSAIAERIDAGETVENLAADYDLNSRKSSRLRCMSERLEPCLLHGPRPR